MKTKFDNSRAWNKVGSWQRRDPFTIIFVYPMNGEPFIIKGGLQYCETTLDSLTDPLVYVRALYHNGKSRGADSMHFKNLPNGLSIYCHKRDSKFFFLVFHGQTLAEQKTWRRMPHRFPEDAKIHVDNFIKFPYAQTH